MQSCFIEYLDARLHYQTGGIKNAPVMVLLHGGFGSINDFAALLPHLQQKFRVIAIDTRGHGRSTLGSPALSYAQAADDVRQILQHENVGQYSLFGFSDGGTIAYRLGLTENGIEKIITVGAHWHRDNLREVRPMFETLDATFVSENMPEQVKAYLTTNPQADLEKWVKHLKAMWLDESENGYPNEQIAQIKTPVLAVRGEADFLLSLEDMAALQRHLPDVHLMNVPFAAHEVLKEQPETVWAAVQAFQAA